MSEKKHLGDRIKYLREKRGLTQVALAKRVKISRTTLTQIEGGDRSLYHPETLYRLAKELGISVDALLRPDGFVEDSIEDPKIRVSIPRNNEKKFKEVLIYILEKIGARPHVGQTVLYKLLYFIDFDYYEKYEEQLIGATYIKNEFGPTPRYFAKIVEEMCDDGDIEVVKSTYFGNNQTKYLPHRSYNPDVISVKERDMVESVINRLGEKNASQLSDYSHGDIPWLATDDRKNIEYELVFYREPPYSQRIDEEDD